MMQDKFDVAETFFEAAVTFAPQSVLAWTMFGLSFDMTLSVWYLCIIACFLPSFQHYIINVFICLEQN